MNGGIFVVTAAFAVAFGCLAWMTLAGPPEHWLVGVLFGALLAAAVILMGTSRGADRPD